MEWLFNKPAERPSAAIIRMGRIESISWWPYLSPGSDGKWAYNWHHDADCFSSSLTSHSTRSALQLALLLARANSGTNRFFCSYSSDRKRTEDCTCRARGGFTPGTKHR